MTEELVSWASFKKLVPYEASSSICSGAAKTDRVYIARAVKIFRFPILDSIAGIKPKPTDANVALNFSNFADVVLNISMKSSCNPSDQFVPENADVMVQSSPIILYGTSSIWLWRTQARQPRFVYFAESSELFPFSLFFLSVLFLLLWLMLISFLFLLLNCSSSSRTHTSLP